MSKGQSRKKAVKCTGCGRRFPPKGLVAHRANNRCPNTRKKDQP